MKIKIITWQNIYHQTNITLNFCGLLYHLGVDVNDNFSLSEFNIYETITAILFFKIQGEESFMTEDKFEPHSILYEEELEAKYLLNGELKVLVEN